MTNQEIATLLAFKSATDLAQIGDLTADEIIANRTEQDQDAIAVELDLIGISVLQICERKKAPAPH